MQTTEIRETWTALYARLSLDDGNVGESMSIQSQKAILTRKAEELGIYNYQFYVDDGYSGTNFNRPSFQQMIADIEAGKVTCVITKDLSRLGRNYLESKIVSRRLMLTGGNQTICWLTASALSPSIMRVTRTAAPATNSTRRYCINATRRISAP